MKKLTLLVLVAMVAFATSPVSLSAVYSPVFTTDITVVVAADLAGSFSNGTLVTQYVDSLVRLGIPSGNITSVETTGTEDIPFGDLSGVDLILLTTADNWFDAENITAGDKVVLSAYLDGGGNLLFCGQDYLWGTGGPDSFDADYLGIDSANQDFINGEATATVGGITGSLWDGLTLDLTAADVYSDNDLYTDEITPVSGATALAECTSHGDEVVGIIYPQGTFNTAFFAFDIAAAPDGQTDDAIEAILDEWFPESNIEETTWGQIKAM